MFNMEDFYNFIKSDATLGLLGDKLGNFVFPDLFKDMPYVLGYFPFEPGSISYSMTYEHTSYKMPEGSNYDATVKEGIMQISISNAYFKPILDIQNFSKFDSFKNSYGKNIGSLDVMLFKFMGYHQAKKPILLKTTKFLGLVLLNSWGVSEAASNSCFNVTLKQTSLTQFNQSSKSGKASGNISRPNI